jgi:DNA-binding MarR family transcriptional regulator
MVERPDKSELLPITLDRPPRAVGFLVSQLGFVASRGFVKALQPLGIGPREFTLLRVVAASAGQSQQTLAERLAVPPSRMVAIVDGLEDGGLLERRPHPNDRRVHALHLTAKGRRVLARAAQVAIEYEAQLCSELDEEERELLIDLLHKLQGERLPLRGVHPGLAEGHPGQSLES